MKTVNPPVSSFGKLKVNGKNGRTIKLLTLGCKVNQYDTQVMRERFLNTGFKEIDNHQPADFYVINTCTVTHKADAQSYNFIRRAKRENPKGKIIVTGCLAELDADKIKDVGGINLLVKNKDKENILEQLSFLSYRNELNRHSEPTGITNRKGISYFKGHTRAFLKVQDGCDNFCSYCKVPLVRGSSRSKPLSQIIAEARVLAKNGFKEIVLSGICLGSYGRDLSPKSGLAKAIEAIENIDGILRIRLSSIEAKDVSPALIAKIANSKKLCRHLHIPLQSGSDQVLKDMHRHYSPCDFLKLVKRIKSQIPDIAITTDCLVGFPTESESQFQNTLDAVKEILPLKVHIFPYSRREGTAAAANFNHILRPEVVKDRLNRLRELALRCSLAYQKQFLDQDLAVLMETQAKDNPAFWEGHSSNYLKVRINSKQNLKNQLVNVRLKKITKDYILGDKVGSCRYAQDRVL